MGWLGFAKREHYSGYVDSKLIRAPPERAKYGSAGHDEEGRNGESAGEKKRSLIGSTSRNAEELASVGRTRHRRREECKMMPRAPPQG